MKATQPTPTKATAVKAAKTTSTPMESAKAAAASMKTAETTAVEAAPATMKATKATAPGVARHCSNGQDQNPCYADSTKTYHVSNPHVV